MRFIDEATIRISGGHGGPGSVSFRRAAFEPKGGPDGGNGGNGGQVVFLVSSQLSSLRDLRLRRVYQARHGMRGGSGNCSGRHGEDCTILVPPGTQIRDSRTQECLVDLIQDQQTWVACRGGRGGKGNAHFATSTHQSPRFAQPGEPGEHLEITLELKLLADIGIIGLPNAGKSSLLRQLSRAQPVIGDYPFTTLCPQLGVVSFENLATCTVADIPGLIEGAHEGKGLGHQFLRHIQRTRLLLHLLDVSPLQELECPDEVVLQSYRTIRQELSIFDPQFTQFPEIVVLNKSDQISDPARMVSFKESLKKLILSLRPLPLTLEEPFLISCQTGEGLSALKTALQLYFHQQPSKQPACLPDDPRIRFCK